MLCSSRRYVPGAAVAHAFRFSTAPVSKVFYCPSVWSFACKVRLTSVGLALIGTIEAVINAYILHYMYYKKEMDAQHSRIDIGAALVLVPELTNLITQRLELGPLADCSVNAFLDRLFGNVTSLHVETRTLLL